MILFQLSYTRQIALYKGVLTSTNSNISFPFISLLTIVLDISLSSAIMEGTNSFMCFINSALNSTKVRIIYFESTYGPFSVKMIIEARGLRALTVTREHQRLYTDFLSERLTSAYQQPLHMR